MNNKKKVTRGEYDYWCLRSSHEQLAIESGNVRHMVICAKERMASITTSVTCGDESKLAYDGDNAHMYAAMRLLIAARDSE